MDFLFMDGRVFYEDYANSPSNLVSEKENPTTALNNS